MSSLNSDYRDDVAIQRPLVASLRLWLAIQSFGVGASALNHGTAINSLLFGEQHTGGLDLSQQAAQLTDQIGGYALLVAGLWILLHPRWPVLLSVALWQVAIASAGLYVGGKAMSQFALAGQSLRYVVPLALILLASRPTTSRPRSGISAIRINTAIWMLRIATATVFAAHGIEAILLHPGFVDLIFGAANIVSWEPSQSMVESMLRMFGVIDIALALMLLADRWWPIAGYMAIWGALTAFSRVVNSGWGDWPEAAMRACNGGVPLALGVYWFMKSRRTRNETASNEETK